MIVELVKLGVLGFATAILIFSFLLLQKVMGQKEFEGDNLLVRCKEIRIFMLMSIVVILIGMAWELFDPRVTVKFDVSPIDTVGLVVKVGGEEIDIKNGGEVPMRDRYQVSLNLVEIDRTIRDLTRIKERLQLNSDGARNQLLTIKQQQAKEELKSASIDGEAGL